MTYSRAQASALLTPRVVSMSEAEPITVADAGFNLKAANDGNSPPTYYEASLIARLIRVARASCEEALSMSLKQKVLEVATESFMPAAILLPWGPVRSIDSVMYIDSDGADQIVNPALYRITRYKGDYGAVIWPAYNETWPSDARSDHDSVRIRYNAGYPSSDSPPQTIPDLAEQAMHLLIAHWWVNREAVNVGNIVTELPLGVASLLHQLRRNLGV